MVQVDLAMSYGFGSGMALAAHRQLRQSSSRVMNRYGMSAVLWFAPLFVPHAMYLLWQQPAWHTMFVAEEWSQIPPWVAGLYPMGITALGVAGFAATAHFIQKQRYGLAWLVPYLIVMTYWLRQDVELGA